MMGLAVGKWGFVRPGMRSKGQTGVREAVAIHKKRQAALDATCRIRYRRLTRSVGDLTANFAARVGRRVQVDVGLALIHEREQLRDVDGRMTGRRE